MFKDFNRKTKLKSNHKQWRYSYLNQQVFVDCIHYNKITTCFSKFYFLTNFSDYLSVSFA